MSRSLVDAPLPDEVREILTPWERANLEIALRMNREPAKAFWTQVQRVFGAAFVRLLTRNVVRDYGFEHLREAYQRGSVLLVANHRTHFDMFVVSSLIHRRLPGRKRLYFPVIGQYYYQSFGGMALNQLLAWWSMFPPLFALPTHAVVDRYSLDVLSELCARGPGTILGIHPEGGRNLNPDPWSFMRCQPGTGKIIHTARPTVLPVFITGLHPHLPSQVKRNWTGGESARIRIGPPVDLREHFALPGKGSTYKRIVDDVMGRVRDLAEEDRAEFGDTPQDVPDRSG